jgi:serine/threonine protein kinase
MERSFAENRHFFRGLFEIGRRYKILNPDKLRGSYGKLIHMLQDSVKSEVVRAVEFECVSPVQTVWSMCQAKAKGAELLRDPLLSVATREIYSEGKTREQVAAESLEKSEALAELKRRYAQKPPDGEKIVAQGDLADLLRGQNNRKPELDAILTEDNVETVVASVSDHFAFQRFNREPVERMIGYLKSCFDPSDGKEWSLEISRGRGGSCLSHSHRTQYTFVLQSLLLWREIMENMFALWQMTEEDLLDSDSSYRLCDTGQGLNRVQQAPRVSRMMHQILHKVQSEVGSWVGLSVVHLGDRDVPNALVFIDKYTQVPRILGPLVRTLDRIPEVYNSTPANRALFDKEFGGADVARMSILQDFFRHGFDGSGDDGGSCVDGRLTSCWNWCSKVEKKKYFPAFQLTGFSGFDGGFETGLGS